MTKDIEWFCLKCGKTTIFSDTGDTNCSLENINKEKELLYKCSECNNGSIFISEDNI